MKNEDTPTLPLSDHLNIGGQLKQLRQETSLTLEEVAASTKISLPNLRAIESMAYEKLPADPFTRGQIILYGAFLGMDGHLAAEQFFTERDGDEKPLLSSLQRNLNNRPLAPKKMAEPAHLSSAAIACILLVLILCSFTGFCLYFSWNPLAFLTGKIFSFPLPQNTIFHPADPVSTPSRLDKSFKVQALFHKESRILVSLDKKAPIEQHYSKQTKTQWEAEQQIQLEFFQPDSADLLLNGSPLPFPKSVDGRYRLQLPAPAPLPLLVAP